MKNLYYNFCTAIADFQNTVTAIAAEMIASIFFMFFTLQYSHAQSASEAYIIAPAKHTVPAGRGQVSIKKEFDAWLSSAQGGGCAGVMTCNKTTAPSVCGGTTAVTFQYITACNDTLKATSEFTVAGETKPYIQVPAKTTVRGGQSQDDLNAAFIMWLASASAGGGCSGAFDYDYSPAIPAVCGGTTNVTFTYKTACGDILTATSTFTVSNDESPAPNTASYSNSFDPNPVTSHTTLDYGITAESGKH
jgi:hypothetical protein